MFEIRGNCNQAVVFSGLRDEGAIRQIEEICSDEKYNRVGGSNNSTPLTAPYVRIRIRRFLTTKG